MFGKLEHPIRFKPDYIIGDITEPVPLKDIVGTVKFLDTHEGQLAEELLNENMIKFVPGGYWYTDEETGEKKYVITSIDIVER